MARMKLRSRRETAARCTELRSLVASALATGPGEDEASLEAVWQGEGLGMLLWALTLVELPPYDRPFDHAALVELELGDAPLRPVDEVAAALETARLWHWRARTSHLDGVALPPPWRSVDQLVAATAMRAHERGLLPRPLRGDFPAFGTVYRALAEDQADEALSIAWERHRALAWLVAPGLAWDDVPTDT